MAATRGSALPSGPLSARSAAYSSARYSIAWPRISSARPPSAESRRRTRVRGWGDDPNLPNQPSRGVCTTFCGVGRGVEPKYGSWFTVPANSSGNGARRNLSMIPPHGGAIGQKARSLRCLRENQNRRSPGWRSSHILHEMLVPRHSEQFSFPHRSPISLPSRNRGTGFPVEACGVVELHAVPAGRDRTRGGVGAA
jgi:hypothetical protein